MIYPDLLDSGSTVAISAPAGAFDHTLLPPAISTLEFWGLKVKIMPHTLGRCGTFSGTPRERASDIMDAVSDPEVKALICARGGYGAVSVLPLLAPAEIKSNPKWLVGFSDISALHALWQRCGVASVHGGMLKALARGPEDPVNIAMRDILFGGKMSYRLPLLSDSYNAAVSGTLAGGNLSVLTALMGTPYDIFRRGDILFVEDINEPAYKIHRMLMQMRLAGVFDGLTALIAGDFKGFTPDKNFGSLQAIFADALSGLDLPVYFTPAIGHVDANYPLVEGAKVSVRTEGAYLDLADPHVVVFESLLE